MNIPESTRATLAGLIAHDRPTIGGVVDRLVAKGLITRETNPTDRRARVLQLTDAGTALIAKMIPLVRGLQADILPGLSVEERAEFVRLATKVAIAGNSLSRAPLQMPEASQADNRE